MEPIYPFHTHYLFSKYASCWDNEYALQIIEKTIASSIFQQDPGTHCELWRKRLGIMHDKGRNLYYFVPSAPVILKNLEAYASGETNVVAKLRRKVFVQKNAHRLLNEIREEMRIYHPDAQDSSVLNIHIERLERKRDLSPSERKVLKTFKQIVNGRIII